MHIKFNKYIVFGYVLKQVYVDQIERDDIA